MEKITIFILFTSLVKKRFNLRNMERAEYYGQLFYINLVLKLDIKVHHIATGFLLSLN